MSITENVARIKAEIATAAIAAGRNPEDILLCAATKMNDADAVREENEGTEEILAKARQVLAQTDK